MSTDVVDTHRCPPERKTPRADRLSVITSPQYAAQLPGLQRLRLADHVAGQHQEMDRLGLCHDCGYPLDNSYPHPDAVRRGWAKGTA